LLGLSLPPGPATPSDSSRGRSLLPLLNGSGDQEEDALHFAEMCRSFDSAASGITVRQGMYQRCVRSGHLKLICHNGPILMNRFLDWRSRLARRWTRARRRIDNVRGPNLFAENASCDQLHWLNLWQDPNELNPNSWRGGFPVEAAKMRDAMVALYNGAIRGPGMDVAEPDELTVRERLAALGDLER
jgi:hypothetical protein